MCKAIITFLLTVCFFMAPAASPLADRTGQLIGQEIGFLEDFVLAKDREKVLKQLEDEKHLARED